MSIQIVRPADNPYAGIAAVIGGLLGRSAAMRNQAGIADTLSNLGTQQVQQQPVQSPQTVQPNIAPIVPVTSQGFFPQNTPNYDFQAPDLSTGYKAPEPSLSFSPAPVTQPVVNKPEQQAPVKTDLIGQYKSMRADAIKQLTSQRGMTYAQAAAAVDGELNKRIEQDYNVAANQYANSLYPKLDEVIGKDLSVADNRSAALKTIMQVNRGLTQVGKPPVDIAAIKDLLAENKMSIDKVDTGDGIQYYAHNEDGSKLVPIGSKIVKGISAEHQLTADVAMRGQDQTLAGQQAREAARNTATKEDPQIAKIHQNRINAYNSWLKSQKPRLDANFNPIPVDPTSYPDYKGYLESKQWQDQRVGQPTVKQGSGQEQTPYSNVTEQTAKDQAAVAAPLKLNSGDEYNKIYYTLRNEHGMNDQDARDFLATHYTMD